MNLGIPFRRPAIIPEYADYAAFRGHSFGMTGARGVLGSILAARLRQHSIPLTAYAGDVNDHQALADWFKLQRFSHFLHFAAIVPVTQVEANPLLAYQTNVMGTFNVCKQVALSQQGCWFFHCSSSHVYKPRPQAEPVAEDAPKGPQSFYGQTKLAAENVVDTLLTRLGVAYCIGRVFSFTHARQSADYLVPSLLQRIGALRNGGTLEINNPSSVRDIQDAEYVADALLHLARRPALGTVNIGTGVGSSVREIALAVAASLGKQIQIEGTDRDAPGALVADTSRFRQQLAQP